MTGMIPPRVSAALKAAVCPRRLMLKLAFGPRPERSARAFWELAALVDRAPVLLAEPIDGRLAFARCPASVALPLGHHASASRSSCAVHHALADLPRAVDACP
jgi:hypothetical protein